MCRILYIIRAFQQQYALARILGCVTAIAVTQAQMLQFVVQVSHRFLFVQLAMVV